MIRSSLIYFLSIVLFLTSSCTRDRAEEPTPNPDESLHALVINLPSLKSPSTYAINATIEVEIKELDLLVFYHNKDTNKEEFIYKRAITKADISGTGTTKLVNLILPKTPDGVKARIVLVANAHNLLPVINAGDDKLAIFQQITYGFPQDNKWHAADFDNFDFLPMYGEAPLLELNEASQIPVINMIRSLAKVDFRVGYDKTSGKLKPIKDFEFDALHIINVNTKGYLCNYENVAAGAGNIAVPSEATEVNIKYDAVYDELGVKRSELLSEIYIAEATAQTASTPMGQETCLIVEGRFKGETNYYKMELSAGPIANKKFLPVNRNHYYLFYLNNVTRTGSATLQEAIDGPPMNHFLDCGVEVVDGHLITDGQLYMLLSEKEIFTLETTAFSDQITMTTDALTWTVEATTGITLTSPTSGNNGTHTITFDVGDIANQPGRVGKIIVKAGHIEGEVTIRQGYYDVLPADYYKGNKRLEVGRFTLPIDELYTWNNYANIALVPNTTNPYYTSCPYFYYGDKIQQNPPHPASCAAQRWGGHADWRLPDTVEISAMVKYAMANNFESVLSPFRGGRAQHISYGVYAVYLPAEGHLLVPPPNFTKYDGVYNIPSKTFAPYGVVISQYIDLVSKRTIQDTIVGTSAYLLNKADEAISYISTDKNTAIAAAMGSARALNYVYEGRCVRGEISDSYNPDRTFTMESGRTGLGYDIMLQQFDQPYSLNWYTYANVQDGDNTEIPSPVNPAREFSCAALDIGNPLTGWRLPTITELDAMFNAYTQRELLDKSFLPSSASSTVTYYYISSNTDTVYQNYYRSIQVTHTKMDGDVAPTVTNGRENKDKTIEHYRARCIRTI